KGCTSVIYHNQPIAVRDNLLYFFCVILFAVNNIAIIPKKIDNIIIQLLLFRLYVLHDKVFSNLFHSTIKLILFFVIGSVLNVFYKEVKLFHLLLESF